MSVAALLVVGAFIIIIIIINNNNQNIISQFLVDRSSPPQQQQRQATTVLSSRRFEGRVVLDKKLPISKVDSWDEQLATHKSFLTGTFDEQAQLYMADGFGSPFYCLSTLPKQPYVIAGSKSGQLGIWSFQSPQRPYTAFQKINETSAGCSTDKSPITVCLLLNHGLDIVTGSKDGRVCHWQPVVEDVVRKNTDTNRSRATNEDDRSIHDPSLQDPASVSGFRHLLLGRHAQRVSCGCRQPPRGGTASGGCILVATGSWDGSVALWDINASTTRKTLAKRFVAHKKQPGTSDSQWLRNTSKMVTAVEWDNEDRFIISAFGDLSICYWDIETGGLLRRVSLRVASCSPGSPGGGAATGGGGDGDGGPFPTMHPGGPGTAPPRGRKKGGQQQVRITALLLQQGPPSAPARGSAARKHRGSGSSGGGCRPAAQKRRLKRPLSFRKTALVASGTEDESNYNANGILCLEGKVVAGMSEGTICVLHPTQKEEEKSSFSTIRGHRRSITALAWAGDQNAKSPQSEELRLAGGGLWSSSVDQTVRLWCLTTGTCLKKICHLFPVTDIVAFATDHYIFTPTDGNFYLFECTLTEILELRRNALRKREGLDEAKVRAASARLPAAQGKGGAGAA
eukprot:CAMPEP_0194575318 /NCGR_PEP_ID=MMETSP0292-20121207/10831_1 /TAXON_ID=39354 /ORGANISM="Heterosigma akashiwo, Strain CCMP2393" /LENGTH=624 /DNA_ID=CAMNT_0039427043 /DNA_START=49 /DNA_END=1921 /DNA_ORIENTATION=-